MRLEKVRIKENEQNRQRHRERNKKKLTNNRGSKSSKPVGGV
jgi:hypothetical protein